MEEMEQAGSIVGKAGANTTIRARVLDADGNVIEDLGIIVGQRTKTAGDKTRAALKRLSRKYGRKHGSR